MEANKESLEALIQSASEANQELFTSFLDDVSIIELCDENTPLPVGRHHPRRYGQQSGILFSDLDAGC